MAETGLVWKTIKVPGREIVIPAGTHKGKLIVLCADHRGVELKNFLNEYLHRSGYKPLPVDAGAFGNDSCDYPFYAGKAVDKIREYERHNGIYTAVGIGVCGSGQGMAMAANRLGMYSVVFDNIQGTTEKIIQRIALTRQHNNSDFLAISADAVKNPSLAAKVAEAWLAAEHFGEGVNPKYSARWNMLREMNVMNGVGR